ncbi:MULTISPECIES: DUF4097 family beta strand repeat-containing protein [Hymenobacter]|uniref:DUF4097 family beta strand repeat-containing protein n=1 Tax=Hymenobacter TaxID=89966 RepID=UPI0010590F98|nr:MULTISPECIES: DUF4097 family beta strand repeat-containing protein [Hymenobacter]QIL77082.1 DUF4097 family beta strand repeat protein [Hymenobacter sp. HDW8]
MKKTLFLTLLYLLAASPALWAQEYKLKLGGKARKIVLDMNGSDVTLEGYNGDELIIRGNGFEPAPKRAEGLRPVYNSAVDNTKIGLSVTEKDNVVRVVQASRKDTDYVIRVPRQTAVVFTQTQFGSGNLKVNDLQGDLEVNMKNGDAQLLNMGGGVVANSISSDIIVRYAGVGKSPSSISSVSGAVDITMPASSKTTLQLRTISGEVYTDFDINMGKSKEEGDMRRVGGQTVEGTVNGGGTKIALQSISGDVFVRKAK